MLKLSCPLFCLLLLTAARPPVGDLDRGLQRAAALERQGAFEAARRQLREVIRHTSDVEQAQAAGLQVCALWQRQQQAEVSRRCYLDLLQVLGGSEARALARYRAATLALEMGQAEAARHELVSLVDALPHTHGARRAFVLARRLHRELGGEAQEAEFLSGVMSRLSWAAEPGAAPHPADHWEAASSRALLAESMVELGRLRLERHPEAALRLLEGALPVAENSPFADLARLTMARALCRLGQYGAALTRYQEIVSLEQSRFHTGNGPHMSSYYDEALYEMGQTCEAAQRFDEAQRAYATLERQAPTSRLVDDAAYRMAVLSGRRYPRPGVWRDFMQRYPDSRHSRAWQRRGEPAP